MGEEAGAHGRGPGRGAAFDERGAQPFLQPLQPLRDGGLGDPQLRRGPVEGARAQHGGEGGEGAIVEHGAIRETDALRVK